MGQLEDFEPGLLVPTQCASHIRTLSRALSCLTLRHSLCDVDRVVHSWARAAIILPALLLASGTGRAGHSAPPAYWTLYGPQPVCHQRPVVTRTQISTDVAIVGADAAGAGAAVGAALNCLSVVLISSERTPGGMLTAGQIGATDGTPGYDWPELGEGGNGRVDNWNLIGGVWRLFRQAVSVAQGNKQMSMVNTERYLPSVGAQAMTRLLNRKNIVLLKQSTLVGGHMKGGVITSVSVRSAGIVRTIRAKYWVDGSDTGDLVGYFRLPYRLGYEDASHPDGTGEVMAYSYRWTAIEDGSGFVPTGPSPYYGLELANFQALTARYWPSYQQDFKIPDGSDYAVHPFRLFTTAGRLNGSLNAHFAEPATGLPDPSEPVELWDVNGAPNDASNVLLAGMMARNPAVSDTFARLGIQDPYLPTQPQRLVWTDISFVQDQLDLSPDIRAALVADIEEMVKVHSLDFLWFIRGGDMLSTLRSFPGGANLTLRSDWSVSNQLGTPDGFPELLYEREGRRIKSVREETINDICPSYAADVAADKTTCTTAPRYLLDGIVLADGPVDVHATSFYTTHTIYMQEPYQLSYRALIPIGISNLLVGGAIGTDRLAYAAFRLDPVRLMAGGAIGDAIALARVTGTRNLAALNVSKLRCILADQGQATAFVPGVPTWSERAHRWLDESEGIAIQKKRAGC